MSDQSAAAVVAVAERVRPWRDAEADADAALLAEVRAAYPDVAYEECTEPRLAEITRHHGVDFATAFFYDRVRRAPATRAFLDRLDALGPARTDHARLRGRVLIAPGAFYREHPQFGSDGRIVREAAAPLGLTVDMIRVASLGTVRENAAVIRRQLEALDARADDRADDAASDAAPVVLVSLSKGGADARLALEQMGAPPRALRAWINVCGLVHGTPVVDRILSHWWWRAAVNAYVGLRGGSRGVLPEIASSQDTPLFAARASAPRGVLVINVVAFPMRRHLFGISHVHHRYMAARGPSDGLALLRDEIIEPGVTLPVWGSDHYFRLPGVPDVLNRLFRYLADGGWLHAHDA